MGPRDVLAFEGLPEDLVPYLRGKRALLVKRMLPAVRDAVVPTLAPNIDEADRLAAVVALADVFAIELSRAVMHGATRADAQVRARAVLGSLCDRLVEQFGAHGLVLERRVATALRAVA